MADATTVLAAACESKVACLSERDLLVVIAQGLFQLSGGGPPGPPPLGAAPEIYTGIWDDPNGHVTPNVPTEPAIYFRLSSAAGEETPIWHWEKDGQVWD